MKDLLKHHGALRDLDRGGRIGKEEFMWKGKERKIRTAGINGDQFSQKYGGRIPETEVGDDATDREGVTCSGSN